MKKILLICLLAIGLFGQPNQIAPQTIILGAPPPTGVTSVSTSVVGAIGNTTYYYWVVAIFPVGRASVSPSGMLINAPNVLTAGNYVRVSWNTVAGATGYDVLRTTTATLPSSCTCAVVTNTGATSRNDIGGALAGYAVSSIPNATTNITLNNKDFSQPILYGDTPYNSILFANLPVASKTKGLIYLVVDALTAGNCSAGGGSNTPAICWSNGSNWLPIGGVSIGNVTGPGAVTNGYIPQWGASNNLLTTGLPVSTSATPSTIAERDSYGCLNSTGSSFVVNCYNWPSIAPGGALTAGVSNTITLSSGSPKGIAATYTWTNIYLFGGTGTAESTLITGGSCTDGQQSSCTITVTPTYAHSGAWTMGPASFGLQEAINAAGVVGGGTVVIGPGVFTLLGTVNVMQNNITIQGAGGMCCYLGTTITRTADFGDSITLGSVGSQVNNFKLFDVSMTFNLGYVAGSPGTVAYFPTVGAHLYMWGSNTVNVERCEMDSMIYNIVNIGGADITVRDSQFGGLWDAAHAALQITKASYLSTQGTSGASAAIPTYITLDNNVFIGISPGEMGPRQGVELDACEDCAIINGSMGGNNVNNVLIYPNGTHPMMNIRIRGVKFDSVGNNGADVQVTGDSFQSASNLIIDGNVFNGEGSSTNAFYVQFVGGTPRPVVGLTLSNNQAYAYLGTPFLFQDGAGLNVSGNIIHGYNAAGTYSTPTNSSAMFFGTAAQLGIVTGNLIGGNGAFGAASGENFGVSLAAPTGLQANIRVFGNSIIASGLNSANYAVNSPTFSGVACGTLPSIDGHSIDQFGSFTTGSGIVTSCVILFHQNPAFTDATGAGKNPFCTVQNVAGGTPPAISATPTTLTVTTTTTGATYNWVCQ